jgi:hypothetical protein
MVNSTFVTVRYRWKQTADSENNFTTGSLSHNLVFWMLICLNNWTPFGPPERSKDKKRGH